MEKKKVLLIGWDAADWKVIHPLIDNGSMPNLQQLIANGVMGNLASLRPELSPMLWTSIATGKRPYKHGILGFTEPGPDGWGMRPVTNLSRKTKAVWNILNQQNYRSLVVGWWPSHPAEPINGVMVSNHFQRASKPFGDPWPIQEGTIYPQRLIDNLKQLRMHPQQVDPALMQLFVPELARVDQETDHRIESIAKIIADAATVNRAATALMHHEEWDFAAVYFDAIDHFCHGFMDYYPPRLPQVTDEDYLIYNKVVESGYIYHDILLGSLLTEIDDNTTVILVSDHGFHSDHLRPAMIPGEPAGPAAQHRPYGIVVISGPDTKKDELLYGSSLLDICPTILSLFDLPVGDDMDGRVLVNGFANYKQVQSIPSWDDVDGDDGSHPAGMATDSLDSGEAINRLVELGYIEEPESDQKKAAAHARREIQFNLAKSYADAGLHAKALSVLNSLYAEWPDEFRFGIELSHCLQAVGQPEESRRILDDIFRRKKRSVQKAKKEIKQLQNQLDNVDISENEKKELHARLRLFIQEASQNSYGIAYLLGVACHAEGKLTEALSYLEEAEQKNVISASLCIQKGSVYEDLKQTVKAEQSYQKALSLDGENSDALLGLCRLKLADRQNKDAAHLALDVIALRYHTPLAHYYLGCALHRLGKVQDAIKALEQAAQQNPNIPEVYQRLAYIYLRRLQLPEKATHYKLLAKEARKRIRQMEKGDFPVELFSHVRDIAGPAPSFFSLPADRIIPLSPEELENTLIVVSGLPRSGTSMVMQMLKAGGLPVLTDQKRMADEDNPKGYFEHEKIKTLARQNKWLQEHGGKGVKIVGQLLPFLPFDGVCQFRIIFLERDLDEILASQKKMLISSGNKKKTIPDTLLKSEFFKQVERIKALLAAKEIPVLSVQYGDCIADPAQVASVMNTFLGEIMDERRMAAVVDSKLYRNRKKDL